MKKCLCFLPGTITFLLLVSTISCKKEEEKEAVEVGSDTYTIRGVSFNMIKVQGGSFYMGATSEQGTNDPVSNEYPVHKVTLSDYYIGETEVTQGLWTVIMGGVVPSVYVGLSRPVENISWDDCITFITRLNQVTGKKFRLPTEAEWEYAARGGKLSRGYKYSGSNNWEDVAWYCVNSDYSTQNVKTKIPNELGIYDMSGNVFEWCSDVYEDYTEATQNDPQGGTSGTVRVVRGGAWLSPSDKCRVSYRYYYCPSGTLDFVGFRLAMSK